MVASITVGVLMLLAIGVYAVVQLTSTETTKPVQEAEKTIKQENIPKSYTQIDEETGSCIYYYENEQCYVPLRFCVTNPEVRTPQEINPDEYCSETPELEAKTLQSPEGTSSCPFIATEGDLVNLRSIVEDPDEQDPSHPIGPLGRLEIKFSYPFSDSNGVWQTKKGDVSIYNFTVTVTDGEYTEEKAYCIEVFLGNQPPVLGNLNDIEVVAGETIELDPTCTDPDGEAVTITLAGDISSRGWLQERTKKTQEKEVGTHTVTVACSDRRGLATYKSIRVSVLPRPAEATGQLQLIVDPQEIVVKEGETVKIEPRIISESGKEVKVTYEGWMTSAEKQTTYNDAGSYTVIVTATDGVSTVQETVTVTVLNVNRPPQIVSTERQQVR